MLVSCLIGCHQVWFLIVTQYEHVLIVSLHKITLTGNLLNSLCIAIEGTNLLLVLMVAFGLLFYLVLQVADTLLVAYMTPDAVLIDKTYEDNSYQGHHDILQCGDMIDAEQ